jgi:hypothetical protein
LAWEKINSGLACILAELGMPVLGLAEGAVVAAAGIGGGGGRKWVVVDALAAVVQPR